MRKICIRSAGSYDKLEMVESENLQPSDHNVVISVKAIGVNFADVCVRLGVYQSAKQYVGWPITPGFEVSGIVKAVGTGVTRFKPGDVVMGFTRFNAYATEVSIHEDHIMSIPEGFSIEQAAGFPAVFFTAYHALHQNLCLRKGSTVLIHSAAGGVGTALIQLCKAAGHKVVAVIGSSEKSDYLSLFSPDVIIDKSQQDLWSEASKVCPGGYDAIFDANGYTTLKQSFEHLRPTGKLVVYGTHALFSKKNGRLNYLKAAIGLIRTPKFAPLELISQNKSVIGFNVSFLFDRADLIKDCMSGLNQLLQAGLIRPIPVTTYEFEQVADAHRFLESGKSTGKIVLMVKH